MRTPAVSCRSLCAIGRPCRGGRSSPRARLRSASSEAASARSGVRVTIALTCGSTRSMRSRWAATSSRAEQCPSRRARACSAAEAGRAPRSRATVRASLTAAPCRPRARARSPGRGRRPGAWRRCWRRGCAPSSGSARRPRRCRRCSCPCAISSSTSRSRSVSSGKAAPAWLARGAAKNPITRAAIAGLKIASPRHGADRPHDLVLVGALQQVAAAPARMAAKTESSSSNIVTPGPRCAGSAGDDLAGRLDAVAGPASAGPSGPRRAGASIGGRDRLGAGRRLAHDLGLAGAASSGAAPRGRPGGRRR